jgi:hypothetical protein
VCGQKGEVCVGGGARGGGVQPVVVDGAWWSIVFGSGVSFVCNTCLFTTWPCKTPGHHHCEISTLAIK